MSELVDLVEDVKSRKPYIGVVGSQVWGSLVRHSVMTPDKRTCRLAEQGPMSRFCGSLEDIGKPLRIRMNFY